ncbi:MAG: TetR family transcriptional regulator [Eubacteriales bacterium]|nr:TetR family transcriptional regulator [Eubacteriales bacterium]
MKADIKYDNKKILILEAYHNLVAELGMENVSISKVAKEANMPTSLIFYYFENKQDLVYELIDYLLERCNNISIPDIDYSIDSVSERFVKFIDDILSIRGAIDIDSRVYFSCLNVALRDQKAREKFIYYIEQNDQKLLNTLKYFISHGAIHYENLEDAVSYITVIINGLSDVYDFENNHDKFERLLNLYRNQIYTFLGFRA